MGENVNSFRNFGRENFSQLINRYPRVFNNIMKKSRADFGFSFHFLRDHYRVKEVGSSCLVLLSVMSVICKVDGLVDQLAVEHLAPVIYDVVDP